jgi:hypothetical protein
MQTEAKGDLKKIRIAQNTKTGNDNHSAETKSNVEQNSKFDFATWLTSMDLLVFHRKDKYIGIKPRGQVRLAHT